MFATNGNPSSDMLITPLDLFGPRPRFRQSGVVARELLAQESGTVTSQTGFQKIVVSRPTVTKQTMSDPKVTMMLISERLRSEESPVMQLEKFQRFCNRAFGPNWGAIRPVGYPALTRYKNIEYANPSDQLSYSRFGIIR